MRAERERAKAAGITQDRIGSLSESSLMAAADKPSYWFPCRWQIINFPITGRGSRMRSREARHPFSPNRSRTIHRLLIYWPPFRTFAVSLQSPTHAPAPLFLEEKIQNIAKRQSSAPALLLSAPNLAKRSFENPIKRGGKGSADSIRFLVHLFAFLANFSDMKRKEERLLFATKEGFE